MTAVLESHGTPSRAVTRSTLASPSSQLGLREGRRMVLSPVLLLLLGVRDPDGRGRDRRWRTSLSMPDRARRLRRHHLLHGPVPRAARLHGGPPGDVVGASHRCRAASWRRPPCRSRQRSAGLCLGVLFGPGGLALVLMVVAALLGNNLVATNADGFGPDEPPMGVVFLVQLGLLLVGGGLFGVMWATWLRFPGSLPIGFIVLVFGTVWLADPDRTPLSHVAVVRSVHQRPQLVRRAMDGVRVALLAHGVPRRVSAPSRCAARCCASVSTVAVGSASPRRCWWPPASPARCSCHDRRCSVARDERLRPAAAALSAAPVPLAGARRWGRHRLGSDVVARRGRHHGDGCDVAAAFRGRRRVRGGGVRPRRPVAQHDRAARRDRVAHSWCGRLTVAIGVRGGGDRFRRCSRSVGELSSAVAWGLRARDGRRPGPALRPLPHAAASMADQPSPRSTWCWACWLIGVATR